MEIYFFKRYEEERVMHSTSNNIKFTPYSDVNEVIDELFESLCWRYQGNLETSMKGSDFIFDSAQLIYYKCDKVNFRSKWFMNWFFRLDKKEKSNNKY